MREVRDFQRYIGRSRERVKAAACVAPDIPAAPAGIAVMAGDALSQLEERLD